MQLIIERMVRDFVRGHLTRRQLAASLAAPKPSGLRAVSLNHVTVRVADVQRTSQFYQDFFGMPLKQHSATTHILGVGKSFFGIEQKGNTAALDHYDFGIAALNADDVTAKLRICQKITVSTSEQKTVVPVAMKLVSPELELGHLLVGNL